MRNISVKLGIVIQEEMSFEKVYAQLTTDEYQSQ